jgi:hypothetical protein
MIRTINSDCFPNREREREKVSGGADKHYILGWGKKHFSSVSKIPRQCPLVLLVDVPLREGEALGKEKV